MHDTEKPVELMKTLIKNSTEKGDVVFDPFMGIGSTGIAAIELNRDFIGIEIDERYFEIDPGFREPPAVIFQLASCISVLLAIIRKDESST